MPPITPHALRQKMEAAEPRLVVVDVRDPDAFARGTIPGAVNVPYDQGVAALIARQVDRRRPVVLVCGWGHRSAIAKISVAREGFRDVTYLEGGLEAWGLNGLPIERGATGRTLFDMRVDGPVDQRARAAGE